MALKRVLYSMFPIFICALAFQNCSKPMEAKYEQKATYTTSDIPIQFRLESSMSSNLKNTIISDLVWYQGRTGLGDAEDSSYERALFGDNASDHLQFLEQRIKYGVEGESTEADGLLLLASNPGVLYWFDGLYQNKVQELQFDDERIRFDSSRAGMVVFSGYAKLDQRFERVATLVHEARHSDCTGGLPESFIPDLPRFFNGEVDTPNIACGHLHAECPRGHDLEGIVACDRHLWGAYSVASILGRNFYRNCTNCNENEKQDALVVAAESLNRVIDRHEISQKTAPMPNLSSSGVLQGQ